MTNPTDPRTKEAIEFIERVTGEKFPDPSDFQASLKSGVLLCKTLNALKPGTIPRINTQKMPFKEMENVDAYLKACHNLGIPSQYLFMTVDLYEAKNLNQVVQNVITVKRELSGFGFEKQAAGATGAAISYAAEGARDQTSDHKITTLSSEPQAFEQTLSRTGAALRPGQVELTSAQLTPNCQVCLKRITTTFVNACGISWHPQCFMCKRCGVKLAAGKYYEDQSKPYCEKCIVILRPQKNITAVTRDMGFSFDNN